MTLHNDKISFNSNILLIFNEFFFCRVHWNFVHLGQGVTWLNSVLEALDMEFQVKISTIKVRTLDST